jgi:hypothetical protein
MLSLEFIAIGTITGFLNVMLEMRTKRRCPANSNGIRIAY